MKASKKHTFLAALLMMAAVAHAQVFILSDEEFSNNKRANAPGAGPLVPYQGGDLDQTLTPLGGGMAILAALGGAYLLGKKRQKK